MALRTLDVQPIDPNLKTGPSRMMSGPTRMRDVVLDIPYGEYATWLYVDVTGNISIVQWDGTPIVLGGLVAGVWHPIASIMINSGDTTATGIHWGS